MISIKRNFIYNTFYNILTILIPFITTPYISRILGPTGIGAYSYTYSIAQYFVLFTMLGITKYGNRTIAGIREDKNKLSKTFSEIYSMQVITGIVMTLIYTLCLISVFKTHRILFLLQLIYVISAIFDINWFFGGIEEFKVTILRNIIIRLLNILLLFMFVKSKNDVSVYCFILSSSTFLSNISLWPLLLKRYVTFQKADITMIFKHLKFNLILFIPTLAVSLYKIMDKIMLGYMINEIEVGYYENAEKIINMPMSIITSLGTVMLPRISYFIANGKQGKEKQYIDKTILFTIWLSAAISFGILGIADIFVPLFLGKAFHSSILLTDILAPTMIFIAFGSAISNQILIPHKKDSDYIIVVILGALTNLILNLVLISKYLSSGAAVATLITEFVVFISYIFLTKKIIQWQKYFFWLLMYSLVGIIMFYFLRHILSALGADIYVIIIKIILGMIFYVFTTGVITYIFNHEFYLFMCNQIKTIFK